MFLPALLPTFTLFFYRLKQIGDFSFDTNFGDDKGTKL